MYLTIIKSHDGTHWASRNIGTATDREYFSSFGRKVFEEHYHTDEQRSVAEAKAKTWAAKENISDITGLIL